MHPEFKKQFNYNQRNLALLLILILNLLSSFVHAYELVNRPELYNKIAHVPAGWSGNLFKAGCTGVLVREDLVLTARHCLESQGTSGIVYFGTHRDAVIIRVKKIIIPNPNDLYIFKNKDLHITEDFQNLAFVERLDQYSAIIEKDLALLVLENPYSKTEPFLLADEIDQALQVAGYPMGSDESFLVNVPHRKNIYIDFPYFSVKFPPDLSSYRLSNKYRRSTQLFNPVYTDQACSFLNYYGDDQSAFTSDCVSESGVSGGPIFYEKNNNFYLTGIVQGGTTDFLIGVNLVTSSSDTLAWLQGVISGSLLLEEQLHIMKWIEYWPDQDFDEYHNYQEKN